ncbi:FtsK/SpoIIIE family DNA translocase [Pararhodobacter zhoushanensis]|uniref:DNA translocase FtsK n=1 Tax=Pararhodobacter zhoushanensis TaxID=2479545 RepID=A0ABT3GTK0_9RHOB|nr:DNA translocase FtsK 4TM domain-containing protein [Pararhodobacter zhoushanensis]MCW1930847.1 DNA translocase FtsK 4TM domain-containing protein [Pararhodobacter zhoushanensis]
MASYPSPQREPLLDRRLQAVLNQRGKELLGLCLIGLGLILALVLGSYSPEDPSWMAATDAPVHNALGRAGAALAAPLVTITGKGAWGLALALGVWGLRLVIHQGEENIMGRSLFVPVAIAMGSVWLASLVVGPGWSQNFGLGGMFGDTVLAAVMTTLPMTTTVANIVTLLSFAAAVALYLYVLGSSVPELIRIAQFLLSGLILTYAGLLSVLGLSARGVGGLAARGHDQWQTRRETRAQARAAAEHALTQYQPWEEPAAPGWHAPEPQREPQRAPLRAQRHATPDPRGYGHPAEPQVSARRAAPPSDWQPDPYAVYDDAPDYTPDYAPYDDRPARAAHRAAPRRGEAPAYSAEPPQSWAQPDRQGVLGRVASLGRRPEAPQHQPPARQTRTDWAMPEGELIEPHLSDPAQQAERPSPEGLRARIAELMTSRTRAKPVLRFDPEAYPSKRVKPGAQDPAQQAEPPLTGGRREPVLTGPAEPAPMGYAFSHAFGYQPAPAPAAYPGAFAPEIARAPVRAAPPVASQDVLIDDEQDDYDDYDDRYDAPPPRAGLDPETRPAPSASMARRTPVPSRRAQAEAQPVLPFEPPSDGFELPPLALLRDPRLEQRMVVSQDALDQNSRMLESVLEDYGVRGDIVDARPGPVVTQYELEPAPGLKASRVIGLSDDIARSMSALSARVSTVPGRSVIGIELPNAHRETVVLREILATRDFGDSTMRLPLALGKDIAGDPVVANLAKMPHLLIAGTTGSGKSVAINTMILSLLYKLTPAECRLIMIDPKMLELSIYDGIPHLLSPVVTDPKKAVVALKWVVGEMEERYRKMSKTGVRNIEGYNGRVREALAKGEMFKRTVQTGFDDETGDPVFETEEFAPEVLPFIVVIVDEMADLMMVAGKEIEACIQRLAQMARASGIHLIMATQRPSVDVITGTIKANFPTRISFQVTSKIDSRTILGEQGAEQLLGQGDMLYMAGGSKITRVHGPFVSDAEVEEIVAHLKSYGEPAYVNSVLDGPDSEREADIDAVLGLGDSGGEDALYDQAVAIVARDRKCSTSYIQRKLGIGYNKAARLVEQMEDEGVVSTANHVGKREILVPEAH